MKHLSKSIHLLLITLLMALLSGCDDENITTLQGATQQGRISIAITDAPLDEAEELWVRVTGIELKPQNSEKLEFIFCNRHLIEINEDCLNQTTLELDLMKLTGKTSRALVEGRSIPAQQYNWIRLMLDDDNPGYIKLTGEGDNEYPLTIPSGAQTGLKINTQLTVPEGDDLRLTIDFDLRKSLHTTGVGEEMKYILRPALRLVDNSNISHLSGTIDHTWLAPEYCSPAIYLSEYSPPAESNPPVFIEITDDLHPENNALITTTYPVLNNETGNYEYEIGFIPKGSYVVAFTCNAINDTLEENETNIAFFPQKIIEIAAGEEIEVNFNFVRLEL